MRRFVNRAGKASRSRLDTPIIGTRRAWAIALAVAMPTRRPVNRPGPRSTATHADLATASTRAWRADELDGRRQRLGVALAPGRVRRGQHALVAADGAADLHGGGLDAEDQHGVPLTAGSGAGAARRGPRRHDLAEHARAGPSTGHRPARAGCAVVVAVAEREAHLEVVGRQHGQDRVAPLDHHDRRSSSISARPRSSASLRCSSRYTSRWCSVSRPAYSWAMVNVGLVIGSVDAEAARRSPG